MRSALPVIGLTGMLAVVAGGCESRPFSHLALSEASGVTRDGKYLLIVGDDLPGGYFKYPVRGDETLIPVRRQDLRWINWRGRLEAVDLEAIDVLADGRVAVLSEEYHALVGRDGVLAYYDERVGKQAKRGLEGLAVRELEDGNSRLAVLWEGGYPGGKEGRMLRRRAAARPSRPGVMVHDLKRGELGLKVRLGGEVREAVEGECVARSVPLQVPAVPSGRGMGEAFRAPDLVWYRGGDGKWGFVVLLSSEGQAGQGKYEYLVLQRFDAGGRPVGKWLDLNEAAPKGLRRVNWEGLGWFQKGESVVLIHDSPPVGSPTAWVVKLPAAWRR